MAPRKSTQPANTAESSVSESDQRVEAAPETAASGRISTSQEALNMPDTIEVDATSEQIAFAKARIQQRINQAIREVDYTPNPGLFDGYGRDLGFLARCVPKGGK